MLHKYIQILQNKQIYLKYVILIKIINIIYNQYLLIKCDIKILTKLLKN